MRKQRRYGRGAFREGRQPLEELTKMLASRLKRNLPMLALRGAAPDPGAALLPLLLLLASCEVSLATNWSMVYEAVQTPELVCDSLGACVPGVQRRFVLFNEDGLTFDQCADLFDEHLRRLNNNAAVIEYEISCERLMTRGHGTEFQRQIYWLIEP